MLPFLNSTVGVKLLHGGDPDLVVTEVVGVEVILGGDPSQVDAAGVLPWENPHPVKVFVHQLQGVTVHHRGLVLCGSLFALLLPGEEFLIKWALLRFP